MTLSGFCEFVATEHPSVFGAGNVGCIYMVTQGTACPGSKVPWKFFLVFTKKDQACLSNETRIKEVC